MAHPPFSWLFPSRQQIAAEHGVLPERVLLDQGSLQRPGLAARRKWSPSAGYRLWHRAAAQAAGADYGDSPGEFRSLMAYSSSRTSGRSALPRGRAAYFHSPFNHPAAVQKPL